jgi:hypothetical protein
MQTSIGDTRATYDIIVAGSLDPHWADWFEGHSLRIQTRAGEQAATLITAEVDQAGLRGLLTRVWDLNLVVVSLYRRDRV